MTRADTMALHAQWRAWAVARYLTTAQFLAGSVLIDSDAAHFWTAGLPALERAVLDALAPAPQPWRVRV